MPRRGVACGGPAAELFCKEKGFDKATRWSIEPNVGARGIPTLWFGDGRLCKAPNCSGWPAKAAMTQIPAADFASNVGNLAADISIEMAANMTEEELRKRLEQEIEKRSRDAILAAANELKKQNAASGEGKLCTGASFHPVYKVTVVNAGNRDQPNVEINARARPVYRGKNWNTSMRRGEQLTLVAVGTPILPGGPFSAPLLTSKQRFDEDLENWYSDVLFKKDPVISVDVTGVLHCLGGDPTSQFCERKMKNLHTSAPQKVTSAYILSN